MVYLTDIVFGLRVVKDHMCSVILTQTRPDRIPGLPQFPGARIKYIKVFRVENFIILLTHQNCLYRKQA
jgi:hypothetical protein